jgi:hypothetical protein
MALTDMFELAGIVVSSIVICGFIFWPKNPVPQAGGKRKTRRKLLQ